MFKCFNSICILEAFKTLHGMNCGNNVTENSERFVRFRIFGHGFGIFKVVQKQTKKNHALQLTTSNQSIKKTFDVNFNSQWAPKLLK